MANPVVARLRIVRRQELSMANPTFQEQIEALIKARTPVDQQAAALADLKPIADAMTRTFQGYATDIEDAKTRLRALEGIKPEEHAKLEATSKQQAADLAALATALDDYKNKYEVANTTLTETQKKLAATNRERALRTAIDTAKLRIAPDSVEQALRDIDARVKQKDDGSFVVPSTIVSKDAAGTEIRTPTEYPIETYLTKEWAATPFAKRVILADFTSGGGAGGSGGRIPTTDGTKKWKEMSYKEQVVLHNTNPTLAAQMQAEATKE
jgi:hypothetical protein